MGPGRACAWVAHVPHVSVEMLLVAGCEDRKINEKWLKQYRELGELLRIQGSGEAGPEEQYTSQVQAVVGRPSTACLLLAQPLSFGEGAVYSLQLYTSQPPN